MALRARPGSAGGRLLRRSLSVLALTLLPALLPGPATASRIHAAVAGGRPTDAANWPWIAQVKPSGSRCGGSLVKPRWVLTAAHCVHSFDALVSPAEIEVVLGRTRWHATDGETHRVAAMVVHAGFGQRDGSAYNDLALLELVDPTRRAPVGIVGKDEAALWRPGSSLTVLGWGRTEGRRRSSLSDELRTADLPRLGDERCRSLFGGKFRSESMLCAGPPLSPGVNTCRGDSGGPLLSHGADVDRLVGVTSWGPVACDSAGRPGVFARLGSGTLRGWTGANATPAPRVLHDCWSPSAQPTKILLACFSGSAFFDSLRWHSWNQRFAEATGVEWLKDCHPTCVQGKYRRYDIEVRFFEPKPCRRVGWRVFTKMAVRYTRAKPPGDALSPSDAPGWGVECMRAPTPTL